MVHIKKLDRQVGATGPEESQKLESAVTSKPKSSKGIAESESKFETAKPNSLFQSSAYSAVRSTEKNNGNLVRNLNTERHSNSSSSTTNITDGTSNTIVVGEQNTASTPGASTPEASTPSANQDQQSRTSLTGTIGDHQQARLTTIADGTSNTIVPEGQSTESTPETSSGQQTNTTSITDGTSNTIVFGEQESTEPSQDTSSTDNHSTESTQEHSTNPPSQDQTAGTPVLSRDDVTTRERQSSVVVIGGPNTNVQGANGETSQEAFTIPSSQEQQPVTAKDGSTTIGTGGEAQQPNSVELGDGSVRTIEPEGQSTESSQETSSGQQTDSTTTDESTSTSTTETTEGTSNTVTVES